MIPPEYVNWLNTHLQFHFLDDTGLSLNIIDQSKFNIVISNTQKIILKKQHKEKTAGQQLFAADADAYKAKSVTEGFDDLYKLESEIEDEGDLFKTSGLPNSRGWNNSASTLTRRTTLSVPNSAKTWGCNRPLRRSA